MTPTIVYRHGAFGDRLLSAQLVAIARDHGINAVWWDEDPSIRALADVPLATNAKPAIHWWFHYTDEHAWDGRSIMRKALDHFAADFHLSPLEITRRTIPVTYSDDPGIAGTDVAICSRSGDWSAYRDYPRMPELKAELDRRRVGWVDLTERKIRGHGALNWAKKSKVYLGLETGTSHYVAGVVKAGVILQSGYSNPGYWASTYGYECLSVPVVCGNCFLSSGCPNAHRCMMELEPKAVADVIERRMAKC